MHEKGLNCVLVVNERKDNENRVALLPSGVRHLVSIGHQVTVENDAGKGSGISNQDYIAAGANVEVDLTKLYSECEMILRVKGRVKKNTL